MAIDKKTWVNIAAGTVAGVAILFAVSQCNGKRAAERDAKDAQATMLENVCGGVNELRSDTKDIKDMIVVHDADIKEAIATHDADIKDAIKEHDKKVNAKLDSLNVNCKPCQKKKAPVKKTSVKPAPVKPAPAQPCKPAPVVCDETPSIYVTPDTVIVRNAPKPNQMVVVNGENSGTIIVNANGIVSGNAIVNGDNNTVVNGNNNKVNVDKVAEARRKYLESVHTPVVLNARVKCR